MNDFKKGDIVYYIGDNRGFLSHNTPYKVDSVCLSNINIKVNSAGNMTVSYNNKKFISELEYRKRNTSISSQYISPIPVILSTNQEKKFKRDDIVYYIGKGNQLKNDVPYIVLSSNFEGILKGIKLYTLTIKDMNGRLFDGFSATNFISKEEYEKNFGDDENLDDSKLITSSSHLPKSDSDIRMRVFHDTKSGELKWTRPYRNYDSWFRSVFYLKEPPEAYLRFDIRKVSGEWEMYIYYHRNKLAESKLVKTIKQTKSLITIVNKIEDILLKEN